MDRSEQIELISITSRNDAYGVSRPTETTETVFCKVKSFSQSEFFKAGQAGLKPGYQFIVLAAEYSGQTTILYNGVRYSVYRTYQVSQDQIELYAEVRAGV